MHTLSQQEAKAKSTPLGQQLKDADLVAFLNKMKAIKSTGISEYDFYVLL